MPLPKAEIVRLRALREKKHREAEGRFAIEGAKVVAELITARFAFEKIYATPAWDGIRTHEITAVEMARISHYPTPSPVLAVGRIQRAQLDPNELDRGLTLALDGVQDPGNVGTLLRIADWYGLDRVLLSPDCADLFSQKTIGASMGSFARIRIVTTPLPAALADCRAPILGCDLDGQNVHHLSPYRDAVVIIGREGGGLSAAIRPLITHYVTIPSYGRAESLNAAIAGAIVCDNLRRLGSP